MAKRELGKMELFKATCEDALCRESKWRKEHDEHANKLRTAESAIYDVRLLLTLYSVTKNADTNEAEHHAEQLIP